MKPWRRPILLVWLLALLLGGWVIARTPFATDMSAFLPRAPRPAQRVLVDQLRDGAVSRLILLGIEADRAALAPLSRALAAGLRDAPDIALVANGQAEGLAADASVLWRQRYLLSPAITAAHFSAQALHAALLDDAAQLASPLGIVAKRAIPADPTGEMALLIARLADPAGGAHPAMADGVWVSPDGARALLMVQTRPAGADIDGQERALAAIEAGFAAARGQVAGAQAARLVESGPPVFAVRSRARMIADARRFSMIASLLVIAVLLFAYRCPRLVVLALLPVASGVVAGIAAVGLAFGFFHAITLGFGVTLIGEAVDYAIYLFTQTAPGGATAATLPRLWPTLRLGMAVSVCGFSAMLLSSFTGFAQLGLFTIAGLLVALAVTRLVLPALLPLAPAGGAAIIFARPLRRLVRTGRAGRVAVLVLALAALGSVALHRGPYWQAELSSMSPLSPAEIVTDARLRQQIGAPDVRYLLAIGAAGRDQAMAAADRVARQLRPLVASGLITGFDAPGRYLPSEASLRARQAALPSAPVLADNLAQALVGTPFRAESFAPFLADVAAARAGPLPQPADLAGTALGLRLDTLLVRSGGRWLASLPLRRVERPAELSTAVAGFAEPGLMFIDLKAESDRLLADYLREALTLSVAGAAVIVLLLAASLRAPARIVGVLAPLAASVVCTGAIMLAADGRLSIFNLFGLLLVVAVGSNYCLFFEREPAGAGAGAGAVADRVLASLTLADLCTVIGFGVLSFSTIPVLRGIGATVAVGAVLCLVFAAVLGARRVV